MRSKIVITLGAAALLATGCGGKSDPSAADAKASASASAPAAMAQKLTRPAASPELEPSPSPAGSAPFSDQLAYELRSKTLEMADAPGRTTAQCPKTTGSKKGTKVTCTSTYEGLEIRWEVTLGDKAPWSVTGDYVSYEATPSTGILTRDGVARVLYGNFGPEYVLCNDIPKAVLAPLNAPSKYSCEPVGKGKKPTGYGTPVRATEGGPRAY
ncbi:hypothetical protein ABZ719_36995 [Streptomyces sp. NPDC006743]|uniref:hypothetical protein n=1 Tax=Streptomyces sp. NPDC006743 TaxID=3154480 RepID=UPI0034523155